jgi:DNA-directed RNA polymerase specialized sigma24 family protein
MESDDFVQQTFLQIWDKRDQIKDNISLDQQIFAICKNLILNHLKREAKTFAQFEEADLPEELKMYIKKLGTFKSSIVQVIETAYFKR